MNYESTVTADPADGYAREMDGEVADRPAPTTRRRWLVALGVLLAIFVIAYVLTRGSDDAAAPADATQVPTVSVIAPGRTTVEGTITATGSLAARREMPVGVVGEGGRVISVPVEAGQWVRQGQVLAVIDRSVQSQQAQSAAAQIQVAQADANLAQANLDRALQLVERGFISKADVDRLTATRDAASARVRVSQAQYRELLARNARLNIVAPAAGLVLERNVETGQTVGAGTSALFSIARGGEMELLANVGEGELARLSTGVSADVVPVGTSEKFVGQVWQIAPIIDENDRQGTVRIALSYAPELRPGGFATATIRSGTVVAPVLPESAIMSDEQGSYVYIVDAENKVVRRAVTIGDVTDSGIVVASGLTGRERVVLRAGGFLNPGETVRPVRGE
jgi:HlyD family secretion protein